jgi:4-hydroxy-3-polyprenylbenzoate decarboxylase
MKSDDNAVIIDMKRKLIVAVTGASGVIYAKLLLEELLSMKDQTEEIAVVFSPNATEIWELELEEEFIPVSPFKTYSFSDFNAPFASGSSSFETMIICPCTMGTIGRIASGFSDDLITRAADVILKERRKLILVPRETPYNLIHIENMRKITLAGGIICPATPSFYLKPGTIPDLVKTVVFRILKLAEFPVRHDEWGKNKKGSSSESDNPEIIKC